MVARLATTLFWVGCIAVLSMCGDYEHSMWLVLLFRKEGECMLLSGMEFVYGFKYGNVCVVHM